MADTWTMTDGRVVTAGIDDDYIALDGRHLTDPDEIAHLIAEVHDEAFNGHHGTPT